MEERSKRIGPIEWFAIVLFAAMIILVAVSVFFRYVLGIGITWGDEVARLLFVWVVFLGAYIGFKRGTHAMITAIVDRLPKVIRPWWKLMIGVLETGFMLFIVYYGSIQVINTAEFNQKTPGLGVQMYWYYMVMPLTCALSACAIAYTTWKEFKEGK